MTATPKAPDPHEEPLADYGKSIIMVPLIIGGAVIISIFMLWETHSRNLLLAEMSQCEERARVELRAGYAEMRALRPDAALAKADEAAKHMGLLKSTWVSDYAELRVALLLMKGEALMMKNHIANAPASEALFTEALGLMVHSSGELWQMGLLARARARYEQGKYHESVDDLNQVMTRNPNFGAAYYWRALAKQNLGDSKGAREDETQAKNLDSWPPLRDFMQATTVYSRDILCKPDADSCKVVETPAQEQRSLNPIFVPENDD